jgi:lactate permease
LRYWKVKNTWRFPDEPAPTIDTEMRYSTGQVIRAWSPFILLTIIIITWGLQPVKDLFNAKGQLQFAFPGLHNAITGQNGKLLPHIFKFNYLSAAGTAILLAAVIAVPVAGLTVNAAVKVFVQTLRQLMFPVITIASVLAFAYILNDSGITLTMAETLANTGASFPFFAPVLGWLGVFITGSDTSANALFGKLQASTAASIGVDPVITVAANVSGGVVGKMISPQSIAVAAAAGQLIGKESELFRFTVKHSFIMLIFICFIVLVQAYMLKGLVPAYHMGGNTTAVRATNFSTGYSYLLVLSAIIAGFALLIFMLNRKKPELLKD